MKVGSETVVLVTGASSGIGQATAVAFARRGAKLALAARRRDRLEGVATQARTMGASKVHLIERDLAASGAGRDLVTEVERTFGRLDVLVANAGYGNNAAVAEYPPERMARMWQVNYQSGYESIHAALPGMLARRSGHLFLVSSVVGRRAVPWNAAYNATKFAQVALGEALYFELLGTGVRSTVVCPGRTRTEFSDHVERLPGGIPHPFGRPGQDPAVVAERIVRTVGKEKREIRFTLTGKALVLANRYCPAFLDGAVALAFRRKR